MKKIFYGIAGALLSVMTATAQTDVQFYVIGLQSDKLDADAVSAVDTKLRSAFTRTMAASENPDNPFVIEPSIDFTEAVETEGLVMEVGRVKADLTLTAKNHIDGTVFNTVTIPLKGSATGGRAGAAKSMVASLKPTDPVFVRFVRKSRERIADYYAANCATILSQAQMLVEAGRYSEAQVLLSAISPQLSCYDQAYAMLADVVRNLSPDTPPVPVDTVYVDNVVEVPVTPDTVYVDRVIEPPVQTPVEPTAPEYTIKLSHPDEFSFRILSCQGTRIGDQVKIMAELVNKKINYDALYMYFDKAFSPEGTEFERNNLLTRGEYSCHVNIPKRIPIKIEFTVRNVEPGTSSFSYLYIYFGQYNVTVYNLPVEWD